MIRLYGHKSGSFGTVTNGLREGFEANGVLSGFLSGAGLGFDPEVGEAKTPVAVIAGDPNRVMFTHTQGEHKKRWLMLAPNSEGIPPHFVDMLGDNFLSFQDGKKVPFVDGFLAPSAWAQKVLQRVYPSRPVVLCPHGVSKHFKVHEQVRNNVRAAFEKDGDFRVLHMTSTLFQKHERKGTKELFLAWKEFVKSYSNATLDLLVNPYRVQDYVDFCKKHDIPRVRVASGMGFTEAQLASGVSGYHLVAQPSRGEGFGLFPLEGRAAGVPALGTACTGHGEHMHGPGVVVVRHGDLAESDDYWGAKAPSVSPDDILAALMRAREHWLALDWEARTYAESIQDTWSWKNQTEQAIKQILKEHQ